MEKEKELFNIPGDHLLYQLPEVIKKKEKYLKNNPEDSKSAKASIGENMKQQWKEKKIIINEGRK